jgi:predicted transcriptional regulator
MRAGTTQSAIARLERPGVDPRLSTLTRVLGACEHRLGLDATPMPEPDDVSQLRERLALSPAERLAAFTRAHRNLTSLLTRARRST